MHLRELEMPLNGEILGVKRSVTFFKEETDLVSTG
jgi:hypothetical protein